MQRKGSHWFSRYSVVLIFLLIATLYGCAKQGYPSGGPKDVAPPVVVNTLPNNQSTFFSDRQFAIAFDEYVVLKDADNNMLVSPPISPKPTVTTKGKSVVVKLGDSLQPNTTYLFQFREAVADFNEGNLLSDFSYVFSTGSSLDSMELRGEVVDALTLNPREATVTVAAYEVRDDEAMPDSMAFKEKPAYITRCNKRGQFHLDYMKPHNYWLVAVEDENKNMRLDAGEAVAFLERAVTPTLRPQPIDTASVDSTKARVKQVETPIHKMLMFATEAEQQRVLNYMMTEKGQATIATTMPMQQPKLDAMGQPIEFRLNTTRDTLLIWMLHPADSMRLVLSDASGLNDTLKMKRSSKMTKMRVGNASVTLKAKPLFSSKLHYFDTAAFLFSAPLQEAGERVMGAVICRDVDSVFHPMDLLIDSAGLKAILMGDSMFALAQGQSYELKLLPNKVKDIWDRGNDSLLFQTTLSEEKDYGNIRLQLRSNMPSSLICELLDDKGMVTLKREAVGDKLLLFPHLKPATYRLRIIVDENDNHRWDRGDYLQRRQSERVLYYEKSIEVRANWDFEETWVVE